MPACSSAPGDPTSAPRPPELTCGSPSPPYNKWGRSERQSSDWRACSPPNRHDHRADAPPPAPARRDLYILGVAGLIAPPS